MWQLNIFNSICKIYQFKYKYILNVFRLLLTTLFRGNPIQNIDVEIDFYMESYYIYKPYPHNSCSLTSENSITYEIETYVNEKLGIPAILQHFRF